MKSLIQFSDLTALINIDKIKLYTGDDLQCTTHVGIWQIIINLKFSNVCK